MDNQDKFKAVRRLASLGSDFPEMGDTVLFVVRELVSPPHLAVSGSIDALPTLQEMVTGHQYGKIQAIKDYRLRTNISLKESKDTIELWAARLGMIFGPQPVSTPTEETVS